MVASKNPKNLDLYDSLLAEELAIDALQASELVLAKRLMNTLEGVAILATDAKLNVHYANQFAINVFKLNPLDVEQGSGKLPKNVKSQLKQKLKQSSAPFTLSYPADNTVRTLQVIHQHEALSQKQDEYFLHMHDITQRVGTESKLRQTERLLRNVIDTSPDFIVVKDEKSRWLLSNASALSLFKIPKHDYQYKTDAQVANLIDPVFKESFKQLKQLDERAWKSDYSVQKQLIIPMPNGGEKVFDVFKVALFNEDDSRQGILTLARDITENKVAEHHLKDRSAILDALISADWLLNSDVNWESVIPSVLKQLGDAANFSQAAVFKNVVSASITKKSEPLFTWQSTDALKNKGLKNINFMHDAFHQCLKTLPQGQPLYGTLEELPEGMAKYIRRHGIKAMLIVPVFSNHHWWGQIVVERHDDLLGFSKQEVGALMAISRSLGGAIDKENTGQRIAQAQIAFDSASEGIVITDADTKITAVNQGFTQITGYYESEVIGKTPRIFSTATHQIWEAINKQGKWRGETKSTRKSGDEYQELLTVTAVKNNHGKVINYVAVFSDISEIKASQNKLNELVNHDTLTGLPNRRLLNELLDHAIKRRARDELQTAILFIDLDRFKSVNDSLGHQVGDQLLIQVADRINECIRESDIVARLGGDEFLVMMNKIAKKDDAALVAQKIIQSLQREFIIKGKTIYIGASIGIAISEEETNNVESLIKAADTAMYHVKNHGKNHYCFYTKALSTNAIEQFNLEHHLRHAVANNAFSLVYQPQVDIIDNSMIGAEALLRWDHPELGKLNPAEFIHLAEETGLIIPIGEWVMREVASNIVQWHEDGLALPFVSLNVSNVQILKGNFSDIAYGILVETDCDPSLLELEITENTVMQNAEYVIDTLNHIKKLGIGLSIDDFGKSYSSLTNLKRLPVDKIKIDQSFIRHLPSDLDDAVIINTINAMARTLGFDVIAEGVETEAQVEFLKNIGCLKAQGYLYGKPLPKADFTRLLQQAFNVSEITHG